MCVAAVLIPLTSGAVSASATATITSPPTPAPPIQLTLPAPTGPHPVGKTVFHLVDPTRREPWVPSHPLRELMVSVWYPASHAAAYASAPYMPPASGTRFVSDDLGLDPTGVSLPTTHAHIDAPPAAGGAKCPVVMYLTGKNATRDNATVIDEDLASHGYCVVTIDFPYDGSEVEFPDGHVVTAVSDAVRGDGSVMLAERVGDTGFVLDRLHALAAGVEPDADHHDAPAGLGAALDLSRVALIGHSLGGVNVASSMYADRRFGAGMDIDGGAEGPVVQAGLDRPFLIVDGNKSSRAGLPDYQTFWTHLRGWHRDIALTGSGHSSFVDMEAFYPQLASLVQLPPEVRTKLFGTIPVDRAIAWQQTYPRAFADQALRHRHRSLVDRPSSRFPEVAFIP